MKLYFFIKVQHTGDIDLGQADIQSKSEQILYHVAVTTVLGFHKLLLSAYFFTSFERKMDLKRKIKRGLTQSYDKSPYTDRKFLKKGKMTTKRPHRDATKSITKV